MRTFKTQTVTHTNMHVLHVCRFNQQKLDHDTDSNLSNPLVSDDEEGVVLLFRLPKRQCVSFPWNSHDWHFIDVL